ncbi:MAG: hypothetical protein HND56_10240 [Pseudomonadota bacterium]|nr:hypothetical protein [Pseudomonadota bacterium]QKK06045.1 MAG: hypothetical protein HND56_10240 [Pseudomonadota bacterium]
MYSDHESKSGKFLRSTGGGIAYYGSLVAAPIALIFGISSIGPDYNKTTNPDSQTALAAYTQEGQSLTQLFDEAKMLREAAVNQNTPETALDFQHNAIERETQLRALGQDFASRVLTDSKLTEGDYTALRGNLTIDETEYVSLPIGAPTLEEARATVSGDDVQAQATEIRQMMSDFDDMRDLRFGTSFAIFMLSLIGGIAFCVSGTADNKRYDLARGLDKLAQKRLKPKH